MRFADIPQFVSDGSYVVDVSIRYMQEQIDEYLKQGLQINPDFQRGHVWNDQQASRFVEFILRGGRSSRMIYFNHPGWMTDFEGDFVLVDGLQRVTACLRFMNNDLPVFGHTFSEFEDTIDVLVGLRFCVNQLKTKSEVLQWYLDLNSGGVVHSDEELNRVRAMLESLKKSDNS